MAAGDIWRVNCYTLSVKSQPGSDNTTIGKLTSGEEITEVSRKSLAGGTWIEHDRGGWSDAVWLESVTGEGDNDDSTDDENDPLSENESVYRVTVSEGSTLTIRYGAGENYVAVGELVRGDTCWVVEKKDTGNGVWAKLKENQWVSMQYLVVSSKYQDTVEKQDKEKEDSCNEYKVTCKSGLTIRTGPGTKYDTVGQVSYGEVFQVWEMDESKKWIKIQEDQWICADYCETNNKYTVNSPDTGVARIGESSNSESKLVGTAKHGDVVTVLEQENGYGRIGDKQWISMRLLKEGSGKVEEKEEDEKPESNEYTVTASTLNIRSGPGTDNSSVGTLKKGDVVKILEMSDDGKWARIGDNEWIHFNYLKKGNNKTSDVENQDPEAEEEGRGFIPGVDDLLDYNDKNEDGTYKYEELTGGDFANIRNVMGVFGLPYQFLPNTDVRITASDDTSNSATSGNSDITLGYEYAEKIITRIPLLFLSPGRAKFMAKFKNEEKRSILEKLITFGGADREAFTDDLLKTEGRYYTFEYDEKEYYQYVNPMCRIAAIYMGIQDIELPDVDGKGGTALSSINWQTYTKQRIRSIGDFGDFLSIPFYLDAETSISESFSNSTTQSMIASSVNSASDMGRELNFLLGTVGANTGVDIMENADVKSNVENINNMVSKLMGQGNFLSNLATHLTTIATGGKLTFPEIWSDSNLSRDYSCTMKFISPDPDPLSVYLNVLVPLFHLIGLVAPQSIESNPNSYANPFLVRAIYKGFFSVDTGIITSMSVTKGAECRWTPEGVPTSIEVNIGIKDLYNNLAITGTASEKWKYDTMNNTALMDYIATLCGFNIFKPEISRILELWFVNNFENRFKDFFSTNIWGGMQQKVQNMVMGIFR